MIGRVDDLSARSASGSIRTQDGEKVEPREKFPEHLRPRYLGFEQMGSVRAYHFECALPREEKRTFVVTADQALFIKHHVGVQEGPALCLRILTMELDALPSPESPSSCHALTDSDMLAYVFFRNAATVKKHGSKTRASARTSYAAGALPPARL